MKKKFLLSIGLSLMTMIIGTLNVKADISINSMKDYVNNKTAVLACQYDSGGQMQVSIYYKLDIINSNSAVGNWYIYYNKSGAVYSIRKSGMKDALTNNNWLHHNAFRTHFTATEEQNFVCPKNAFLDFDRDDEVCFSNNESCGSRFAAKYTLTPNWESIYSKISLHMNAIANSDEVIELLKSTVISSGDKSAIDKYVRDKEIQTLNNEYKFGTVQQMPPFILNYINNYEISNETFETMKRNTVTSVETDVGEGTITEEQAEVIKQEIEELTYEKVFKKSASTGIGSEVREGKDCEAIFGTELTKAIKALFSFVQYLGPILVAVLSVVDFIKAAVSGDPGDMKKATDKLAKRAIAAVLLFFIPIICGIIFDFAGITVPSSCIVK